ncbi:MAG: mechanosensitive ion channel [Flavihumibacter sp.]
MKRALQLFVWLMLYTAAGYGQDTLTRPRDSAAAWWRGERKLRRDSIPGRFDSLRQRGRGFTSIFADSTKLDTADYQVAIERTFSTLMQIKEESEPGADIRRIAGKLADADSSLAVIKSSVDSNSAFLSLRHLELFKTLLMSIHEDVEDQRVRLDSADRQLHELQKNMRTLMGDSVLRLLMQDTGLRQTFNTQLKDMRTEWRQSIRQFRQSSNIVVRLKTHNSRNAILVSSLGNKVDDMLTSSLSRVFRQERSYLWNPAKGDDLQQLRQSYQKVYNSERKALRYYFRDSVNSRLFLLLIGAVFLAWNLRNIRSLQKAGETNILSSLSVEYLYPYYIASSFVLVFILAPLFDLQAPAVYIESMQFLLILTLTYIFWRRWPRTLFYNWLGILFLFVCFSFTHHTVLPGLWQRLWFILLSAAAIYLGIVFLRNLHQQKMFTRWLRFVVILCNIMHLLAIGCNVFGRLSLATILSNAAIFSFSQVFGLAVFGKVCLESILLQIEGSRSRQGVRAAYKVQGVLDSFRQPVFALSVLLWLIVFATNLNVYTSASRGLFRFLRASRKIGSAEFTFGGVILFFGIIWIAHLLQKYVGYFFGDTGEEEIQNKRQRSKMLIARLVVLCLGYLIAVAASGLPVDKITIVLGALGVGIGLGLQNIVSNFVSGIILIFDRPLQIGDSIEIGNKAGKVREIGLRSSTLLTPAGAEVIIPNGDILSQQITNWTFSNNLQRVGLALTAKGDTDLTALDGSLQEILKHSGYWAENTQTQLLFKSVKDGAASLTFYFWCNNAFQVEQAASKMVEGLQTAYGNTITVQII